MLIHTVRTLTDRGLNWFLLNWFRFRGLVVMGTEGTENDG